MNGKLVSITDLYNSNHNSNTVSKWRIRCQWDQLCTWLKLNKI